MIVAAGIGLLTDIGVFLVQLKLPNVANVIALLVILLFPAIFVVIAFNRARSDDPIRFLFEQPDAVKAPYLLACAAALQQNPDVSVRDKREAIEELGKALRKLKNETEYIGEVINHIAEKSVWAVCGRKTNENAPNFFKANVTSYENHNYIERAFLPPTTSAEASSIRKAIEDYHFPKGMIVRALSRDQDADGVRHTYILPPGFGMTIMGEATRTKTNDKRDPTSKYAVLIHWGGMGAGRHYGVILRKKAWLDYFWGVFERVRGVTDIANPGDAKRKWDDFVREYPAYNLASGRAN